MTITLLEININKHAHSWIGILGINRTHLFYIEWYGKYVHWLEILGMKIIRWN